MVSNAFFREYYKQSYPICNNYIDQYNRIKVIVNSFNSSCINEIVNKWIEDYENGDRITGPNFTLKIESLINSDDNIIEKDFMTEAAVRDYIINNIQGINYNTSDEEVCRQIYEKLKRE